MKIVTLGGAGGMARAGLKVLAAELPHTEFVIADLNLDAATEVAVELTELGHTATAQAVDVGNRVGLMTILHGADLVMNSVGPYSKFGLLVLDAAIDAGCRYVDLCDDGEPTIAMLQLDEKARNSGVSAVVGLGASPGFMTMLARSAAEGLDRVDDVLVGWTLNSVHRDFDLLRASFGPHVAGGNAALEHLLDQLTFTVPGYAAGDLAQWRAREQVALDIPGLGTGTGYVVGHPEPVTLPRSLGAHGSSLSVCFTSSDRAALLDEIGQQIEAGDLTLHSGVERLLSALGDEVEIRSTPNYPNAGDLPTYLVLVTGELGGERVHQFVGCNSKPEPMSLGTGVPYGVATALLAHADLRPGVVPLDMALSPEPFFTKVAERWGVERADLFFKGTVSATGSVVEWPESSMRIPAATDVAQETAWPEQA